MDVSTAEAEYSTADDGYEYVLVPYSQKAVAAFVCAIVAILSGPAGFLFGIPAVVLGTLAQRDTRDGDLRGHALTQWALALGYLAVLGSAAMIANATL